MQQPGSTRVLVLVQRWRYLQFPPPPRYDIQAFISTQELGDSSHLRLCENFEHSDGLPREGPLPLSYLSISYLINSDES